MPDDMPVSAPAASDAAGQQPTDGTVPNSPASQDAATQTPAADGAQQQTQEITNPEAKRAAEEAARYRTQLREAQRRIAEYEAAQKAAEDAQLSELERTQKRLAEAQAERDRIALQTQERVTRAEIRAEATRLGINPQLAQRVIDYSAITYDDNGDPDNIATVLSDAINAYGLNPQPATPATPAAPQVGATNPARISGPIKITPAQYSDPEFRRNYMRDYGEDLLSAMNKGKVQIV